MQSKEIDNREAGSKNEGAAVAQTTKPNRLATAMIGLPNTYLRCLRCTSGWTTPVGRTGVSLPLPSKSWSSFGWDRIKESKDSFWSGGLAFVCVQA